VDLVVFNSDVFFFGHGSVLLRKALDFSAPVGCRRILPETFSFVDQPSGRWILFGKGLQQVEGLVPFSLVEQLESGFVGPGVLVRDAGPSL